ncbi:hypothetical protein OS493_018872 [Desmophyllum pertusum]|uniref:Uncharacterized protein n=1 Tax=Desmophyllum pertusum TaxID=174260 RepID=A0A9W9ZD33_9CNID|nr:hypothetical protein OS493_018872 [Desmophyllum pertusum]
MRSHNLVLFFVIQAILRFSSSARGYGSVFSEEWLNISGTEIQDLTSDSSFPNNATKADTLDNSVEQNGRKDMEETGNYTFYTFCDDRCRLFLSSDINPRNKRRIIDQNKNVVKVNESNCCSDSKLKEFQISPPQYLEETRLYYMEVLYKQGIGYDRMYVAMRTPSGETKTPVGYTDLVKHITKYDIPGANCKTEGDPNYPDYVNCKAFSDSQKIDLVISLLRDLQFRIDNAVNPTADFLLNIMKTAGKRTSDLLEGLDDSIVDQHGNESNRAFEIAREVERLGESIASRTNNANPVIAVNYPGLDMKSCYGELNVSFESATSVTQSGSQNSITVSLGNSSQNALTFWGGNTSSQLIPYFLNSKIISGSVLRPSNESFNGHVTIRLEHTQFRSLDKMAMECAFWRYSNSSSNSTGHWSTDGCYKDEKLSDDKATVCHCNHLTHFAVLMRVTDDPKVTQPGDPHIQALEIITYVGCGLSLLGEILTVITISCLKLTRTETSIIHLNLVSALAVAQIIFLTGIEATQNKAACKIVAVLLHYFNLVSFTWMLVEGVWLYVMIVRVFETGHSRIKKYCACAWGIPFVFVVITLSASFDGYGTDTSCWLSVQKGTIWSFVVPVILIALANSIILGMVVKEILRLNHPTTGDDTKYQSARSGVQSAVVLLPLLGITWLFGILTFNSDTLAFQYLFAIFNSLQGFFIFLFHCLLNSEVRRAFNRKKKVWSESHDVFQTHSQSPQNYNDLSKKLSPLQMEAGGPDQRSLAFPICHSRDRERLGYDSCKLPLLVDWRMDYGLFY